MTALKPLVDTSEYVIVPLSPSDDSLTHARIVAENAFVELKYEDDSVMLVDLQVVVDQFRLWKKCLPRVTPYYAVKCNPDPELISLLASLGAKFDCATAEEIDLVQSVTGLRDRFDIVYANPKKIPGHLTRARAKNVDLTVFDSISELEKIAGFHPRAQLLLRIVVEDSTAQCPMSAKFGATLDLVPALLEKAVELELSVCGVSFHVGSGCRETGAYERALCDARYVFDIAGDYGLNMNVLDIGGGFPGDNNGAFVQISANITDLLDNMFPVSSGVSVVAEPGRFFASLCHTLVTRVISVGDSAQNGKGRYYLNDGLYGSFNCVLYDHQQVTPYTLDAKKDAADRAPCILFGPTCDGFDVVCESESRLPVLSMNDILLWLNMGAYTSAAASGFNGFSRPKVWYYFSVMQYDCETCNYFS